MIAFASIFLALVVGPQMVEVLVGESVAVVEIRLDGEPVGSLRGEPWALVCDFGSALEPHELLAVAYDAAGGERGRAKQRINLPRPRAEAGVVIEDRADGQRVARLTWESLEGSTPSQVTFTFDGELLVVDDPEQIELPPYSNDRLHFLRAELDFTDNVSALVEVTFGGFYADRVNTNLTAVPVSLNRGAKLPEVPDLGGWFTAGQVPLRVVAAEKGPAEVLIVQDISAREVLSSVTGRMIVSGGSLLGVSHAQRFPQIMTFRGKVRTRFLWPHIVAQQGRGQNYHLFPLSADYDSADGGLPWILTTIREPSYPPELQRLTDAVAVAGMTASASGRRRAVVLLLGAEAADHSHFDPPQVRGYLESLHVPLVVWSTAEPDKRMRDVWGSILAVTNSKGLRRAVRELNETLERQRVVWIDGEHLPQNLRITQGAVGVSLLH